MPPLHSYSGYGPDHGIEPYKYSSVTVGFEYVFGSICVWKLLNVTVVTKQLKRTKLKSLALGSKRTFVGIFVLRSHKHVTCDTHIYIILECIRVGT